VIGWGKFTSQYGKTGNLAVNTIGGKSGSRFVFKQDEREEEQGLISIVWMKYGELGIKVVRSWTCEGSTCR
jgi:hypothetical protein